MKHKDSYQEPIDSVLQDKLTEAENKAKAIVHECQVEFIDMKMPRLQVGEEWWTAYAQAIKERSQKKSNFLEGYVKLDNLQTARQLLQLIEAIRKTPSAELPGLMFDIGHEYGLLSGRNKHFVDAIRAFLIAEDSGEAY
jgi:hypothetical protein